MGAVLAFNPIQSYMDQIEADFEDQKQKEKRKSDLKKQEYIYSLLVALTNIITRAEFSKLNMETKLKDICKDELDVQKILATMQKRINDDSNSNMYCLVRQADFPYLRVFKTFKTIEDLYIWTCERCNVPPNC